MEINAIKWNCKIVFQGMSKVVLVAALTHSFWYSISTSNFTCMEQICLCYCHKNCCKPNLYIFTPFLLKCKIFLRRKYRNIIEKQYKCIMHVCSTWRLILWKGGEGSLKILLRKTYRYTPVYTFTFLKIFLLSYEPMHIYIFIMNYRKVSINLLKQRFC